MSSKSNFWKSLAAVGKTALSHVNLSFDGANRTFHIDIVPIATQPLIATPQDATPVMLPTEVNVPMADSTVQAAPASADQ